MSIIITKLYNGKVEMRFDSYWHTYTVTDLENGITDVPVTAITTALGIIDKSKQLLPWAINQTVDYLKANLKPGVVYDELQLSQIIGNAKKASNQNKTDAGDYGTLLHAWIESFVKHENPPIPVNEMLAKAVKDFLKWTVMDEVKFLVSEQPLYSRKWHCAGTMDCAATVKGKLYVGDWKTSSRIYLTQEIQTAGYRMMRTEEYPEENYVGQFIVRFGKDGKFEKKFIDQPERNKMLENMFIYFLKGGDLYRQLEKK